MRNLAVFPLGTLDTDTQARGIRLGFSPFEAQARIQEQKAIQAEREAYNRRLDRDRIINEALDRLITDSVQFSDNPVDYRYIAGASGIPIGHGEPSRADYVRELLTEIRSELSPLVRSDNVGV